MIVSEFTTPRESWIEYLESALEDATKNRDENKATMQTATTEVAIHRARLDFVYWNQIVDKLTSLSAEVM